MTDPPHLYTTAQAAQILGLSPPRVRALAVRLGVGHHHGRDWLFDSAHIEKMRQRETRRGRPKIQ